MKFLNSFPISRKTGARTVDKYVWTNHARDKMRFYRLTESRVIRIIRHPVRIEEGVLEGAVACMQPAGSFSASSENNVFPVRKNSFFKKEKYSEIWAMYVLDGGRESSKSETRNFQKKRIKIITAWRYPGKSPERDPVPAKVLEEVRKLV